MPRPPSILLPDDEQKQLILKIFAFCQKEKELTREAVKNHPMCREAIVACESYPRSLKPLICTTLKCVKLLIVCF